MAVGSIEGATVGSSVVNKLGAPEDCPRWCNMLEMMVAGRDGIILGFNDGKKLGSSDCKALGARKPVPNEGRTEGDIDGSSDGATVGSNVGRREPEVS
jgi:hypothetical protein